MTELQPKSAIAALNISSTAFEEGELIPEKYTCDGKNISPPLQIDLIPDGAKSLALIADDPDAPSGTWVHWVVWNIPSVTKLAEGEVYGEVGVNDFHENNYSGPCPPSGIHRYYFKFYALDELLDIPMNTTKSGLENIISDHILASGELMGRYGRGK